VNLYIHSHICLHGVVLHYLNTGTYLPSPLLYRKEEHAVAYPAEAYGTSQKVMDSIPDEVTGFFNSTNLSSPAISLWSN
jgi:hypothetical protein